MFNPQRRSKVADIYMQQKIYQLHRQKMADINFSTQGKKQRYSQQQEQQKYVNQLKRFKNESQSRQSANIKKQNRRLLDKLVQTDNRRELNPQQSKSKRHFNSYYSMKKEDQRIRNDNYTMIVRMVNKSADIPTLRQMKKQYKKSRKLAKNCRKLPSIMRLENGYKTPSSSRFRESSTQGQKSRSRIHQDKIEKELLE